MSTATACKYEYRCTRCFRSLYAETEEAGTEKPCQYCGQSILLPEATPDRIERAANSTEDIAITAPAAWLAPEQAMSAAELERELKKQIHVSPGEMICLSTIAASRVKRFLGILIDNVLLGMTIGAGVLLAFWLLHSGYIDEASLNSKDWNLDLINFFGALYFPAAALLLWQWNMTAVHGKTIGKKLLGTKVVVDGGRSPGLLQGVILRNWLTSALNMIPFFSLIDALFIFGESRRCLHDYLAGTYVVDDL
jgi:uncharacterized RDD family membrane protein YckC/DNA-directed RNA polymerase subunit RPC12/RpoP